MAEAAGTTSTTDWIWLREALALAVAALGSVALAKGRLTEWLAAGKVPWTCMSWEGLDAKDLAKLKQERDYFAFSRLSIFAPSAAYYPGDPEFWNAIIKIDWEEDGAYELARLNGAHALGIKVSRTHLLELLPADPHKHEQVRGAGTWITAEVKRMKEAKEIPPDIRITDLAHDLERRMRKAAASNKLIRPIKARSIENGLRVWGLWPITPIK
jgi:hypothetical protein